MSDTYLQSIETWRAGMERGLRAENSWLALAGLCWLDEGDNGFGTDPSLAVVMPPGTGPARAGTFTIKDGAATATLSAGVSATLDGRPVSGTFAMRTDDQGTPEMLAIGAVTMIVIKRGDQHAIRMWDNNSPMRGAGFPGRQWYAADPRYRIEARFMPFEPPKPIKIQEITGTIVDALSPGWIEFELDGAPQRLEVEGSDISKFLFINFKDTTNGHGTYPSGRFLQTEGVKDGRVVVDFNKAYCPPCAFTPYATCPLPRRENWMTVGVPVGEKFEGHHP